MTNKFNIAVDAMGGDNAPKKVIEGVDLFLKNIKNAFVNLYGDKNSIEVLIKNYKNFSQNNHKVHHAEDKVPSDASVRDSIKIGNFYGDILGFIAALGLAIGAVIIRSAKKLNLVPSAVIGKLFVACFAVIFIEDYSLIGNDLIIVPLMCLMCVAIPFVLVTIAPRFITAAEVNLFFLLETIIGPIWVWLIIKEQPTTETILGGIVIIVTIAVHSFLKLKKS